MFAEFILPVVAYLITLLVLWATVAITKAISVRRAQESMRARPLMVGTRTH